MLGGMGIAHWFIFVLIEFILELDEGSDAGRLPAHVLLLCPCCQQPCLDREMQGRPPRSEVQPMPKRLLFHRWNALSALQQLQDH